MKMKFPPPRKVREAIAATTDCAPASPIRFFIEGEPKGQPRPRAFSRNGHAAVYDPGTAEGWKGQVALAARPHLPTVPYNVPLRVVLWFSMKRPLSHYQRRYRDITALQPDALRWHIGRPDCDNLAKAVLDALTTIRFWVEDDIVASLDVRKVYGERPGCSVMVSALTGELVPEPAP